ncbi:hypothetical protein G6M89_14530 [Natronolimnobius sp. AArcel1]|uniref:hypothetical protein n=1 Tax=Natronolimnobius sp. AArcel1 TaxID=1679093 RepID=UPI0013EAACD1|nr:hypothetical protein [Natronolimnobius sp. AArcel1]NGM70210.1 hypothetical protein [Natronolimnobius sp. AArcel1]
MLSETNFLSLTVVNFTDNSHEVAIEVLYRDASTYQESVAIATSYELPAPDDDVSTSVEEDQLLETDRFIVNVELKANPAVSDSYYFYPALEDDDQDDHLFVEIRTQPESDALYIDFDQSH